MENLEDLLEMGELKEPENQKENIKREEAYVIDPLGESQQKRERENVNKDIRKSRNGCFSWIKAILIIPFVICGITGKLLWG